MNNNDILRRTRYILDLKDNQITKIYKHLDVTATEQQVNSWLKREDEPGYVELIDEMLIDFLDALIIEKRGVKDDAPRVKTKQQLDNNLILMKLKIAFHLKAEDALEVMSLAGFNISKHEFSALFRKKDHKHYRACKNQMLRKFMKGLQIKYRGQKQQAPKTPFKDQDSEKKTGTLSIKKPKSNNATKTNEKTQLSKQNAEKTNTKSPTEKNSTPKTAASVWKVPKKN